MSSIELSASQREQMAGLIEQLNKTRTVAEAFVGYFAKELNVNLQMYQFNADTLTFDPVQGFAPPQITPAASGAGAAAAEMIPSDSAPMAESEGERVNGKVEAI